MPKISRSINPATTGDTENGKSMSAVSSVAAREREAGDGPSRRDAEDRRSAATAIGATISVSKIGVPRVGVRRTSSRSTSPTPCGERLIEHMHDRHDDQHADDADGAAPISSTRTHERIVRVRGVAATMGNECAT